MKKTKKNSSGYLPKWRKQETRQGCLGVTDPPRDDSILLKNVIISQSLTNFSNTFFFAH